MSIFGPYRGVVDVVHDGDTIHVRLDVGFDLSVYARCRLLGINAPELSTAEGKVARDALRAVVPVGTEVQVYSHGWDKYGGRIDAQVFAPFGSIPLVDLSSYMLDHGYAVVMR